MAKKKKSEEKEPEEVIAVEEEKPESEEPSALIEAPKPTMKPEEIESRYQAFLEKIKRGGK